MVGIYDRTGLQFCYPENWTLCDEQLDPARPSVSVQSPGTAFWSLAGYPATTETQAVAAEALRAMRSEYESLEFQPIADSVRAAAGEDVFGYDMQFFCLDMVISARVVAFRSRGRTFLVQWQAEDQEFESLREVFQAMTLSVTRQLEENGGVSSDR